MHFTNVTFDAHNNTVRYVYFDDARTGDHTGCNKQISKGDACMKELSGGKVIKCNVKPLIF